jgi:hypothetical protein
MTRIEKSVRELSDLHEFYRKISKMRIKPHGGKAKHNKSLALNRDSAAAASR